jgi:hypothetical protein
MLSCLFHSLFYSPWSILFATFLTHRYVSTNYPIEYNDFCFKCAYYSINLYSKAQIIYLKIKPKVITFLEPIFQIEFLKNNSFVPTIKLPLETLEFIKNGKVIYYCLKNNLYEIREKEVPEFDFILYSSSDPECSEIINKKMLYHYPLNKEDFIIEKTNYILMMTEISIEESEKEKEQHIIIDLISKKYNYFIVNNKINAAFLTYFLMKYHNYNLTSNKYNIKIIDENIHVKNVNGFAFEEILFNKNNFEINSHTHTRHFVNISTSFDGKKISDYISFSNSHSSDLDTDLPDLEDLKDLKEEDNDYIESFSYF